MMKILKPTAIIDEVKMEKNISRMVNKTNNSKINFRPHFKTHQSKEIGILFKKYGVSAITVSSLDMAIYFAEDGWKDITIAIPCNINQIDEINCLAKKIKLGLLVDSRETAQFLVDAIESKIDIWIEIDIDYHRSGIDWRKKEEIYEIAKFFDKSEYINFNGILTHAGNSYGAQDQEQLIQIYKDSVEKMNYVKEFLIKKGLTNIKISIGDTPTCSIIEDFFGVDEIRPGNFVFYDLTQYYLGVCKENEIALVVACPVISKNLERNELVVHGGAIHLSKDSINAGKKIKIYGKVALLNNTGWGEFFEGTNVNSLSQEHGVIKTTKEIIKSIKIGDILAIIPVHSCLTANMFINMYSLKGNKFTTFRYS